MTGSAAAESRPRRRVMQNVFFTVLARAQGALFTYLIIRLLLNSLSIEQYGLHSLLFVGLMINMSMLTQFGMHSLIGRFLPEYYSASRFPAIAALFSLVCRFQGLIALILAVFTMLFASRISGWIGYPESTQVVRIFAFAAVAYLFTGLFQIIFGAIFRHRIIFVVSVIYNTIRLGGLYYATQAYGTFSAVVISESVMIGISALIYAFIYLKIRSGWRISREKVALPGRQYFRYAAFSYTSDVGNTLLSVATDLLLVSNFVGGIAAGYYGLANRINDLVYRVLPDRFLAPVTTPLFFSEYGTSRDSAGFGFTLLTKVTMLIAGFVSLWLALMSGPVIAELFDSRYVEAAGLVTVMALFIPLSSLRRPLGLMLQNAERTDLLVYAKVTAVVKIIAGLWLVPKYGVMGMVWIAGLALMLEDIVEYYFVVTRLGYRTDEPGILKMVFNGAVAAGIFMLIRPWFTGLGGVLLSPFVFFVFYAGMNLLNKSFRPEERDFINRYLKYPIWKF